MFSDAALREKVKKIMGSNYFTITPEMVVAPVEAAAEAGHFGSFQVAADNEQKVCTFDVYDSLLCEMQSANLF